MVSKKAQDGWFEIYDTLSCEKFCIIGLGYVRLRKGSWRTLLWSRSDDWGMFLLVSSRKASLFEKGRFEWMKAE